MATFLAELCLTSTQVVGISAGLLLILNLYQPGDSEWSQIRSWMAVFWISVESKSTLRYGLRKVRWPPGEHSGAEMRSEIKVIVPDTHGTAMKLLKLVSTLGELFGRPPLLKYHHETS